MDKVARYCALIEKILCEWAELDRKNPTPGVESCCISDEQHNHFLLMDIGWQDTHRILRTMLNVRTKEGKIWIEEDWTEEGITKDLLSAGVPKEDIVLGFHSPYLRSLREYAAV
jgi:hypothetical protein